MRTPPPFIAALALSAGIAGQGLAQSSVLTIHSNYVAMDLLQPCLVADNDARDGAPFEVECEQYIIGFVDALEATGTIGSGTDICLPEQNIADEVRWAFMRWVYDDYSARTKMTAAEAMLGTMRAVFPCS